MGVYVFNKFKNYTIISNLILTDESLSLEEKGLFCYLFSKPDGWEFHYNAMKKELQEKSDKTIRKILNRLVETGYITKCQVNSTNGHFGGISIKFTDKSFVQQNNKNTDCPNLPFGENTDCPNLPSGKNGESVKMPSNNTYNNNNTNLISTTNISNNINNNIYNNKNKKYIDNNINNTQSNSIKLEQNDKLLYESYKKILETKDIDNIQIKSIKKEDNNYIAEAFILEKKAENLKNDTNIPKTENNAKKEPKQKPKEEIDSDAKPKKRFVKPTIEQVREYVIEAKLTKVDPDAFYDHFESNGWKVSGITPMKDWKAAVRNWNRRADNFNNSQKSNKNQNVFLEEYKRLEEEERNNKGE